MRTRATESQDGKNRVQRMANLRGAISVRNPEALSGRRVLLIDDVMTTGATFDEAARVCLAANAAEVNILVLALVMKEDIPYIPPKAEDEAHGTG
ncbi:MAG: phosphoribosyltransferase family protein [Pseudomonadota bacterium]